MDYSKINTLLTDKRLSVPQLADKIGMTKRGLYASIENKTLTISTLEKISEALDVPILTFFNDNNSADYKIKIDQLEQLLAEVLGKFESTNLNLKNTIIALLAIKAFYSDYIEKLSIEDKLVFQKSSLAINIEKITNVNWLDVILGNAALEITGNIKGSDTIYSLDVEGTSKSFFRQPDEINIIPDAKKAPKPKSV